MKMEPSESSTANFQTWGLEVVGAYPLSMTRAATSSVDSKEH